MHTEDLLLHHRCEGEAVETVVDSVPDACPHRLSEAVDTLGPKAPFGGAAVDRANLVVTSQHVPLGGGDDLVGKEVGNDLGRAVPAVHVISDEEEACGSETDAQRPEFLCEEGEIVDVAVNVAENVTWRIDGDDARFLFEYLGGATGKLQQNLRQTLSLAEGNLQHPLTFPRRSPGGHLPLTPMTQTLPVHEELDHPLTEASRLGV
mmetsp:Transcript_52043/g.113113  ORF Transcript_52043/g.113113 Transcript_52043/m.113113 type:complete len:206 (-) Transcript_52043:8-625(-)